MSITKVPIIQKMCLLEVVLKPADLVVFSHNVHIRLVFGRVSLQHRVRRPRVTEKVLVHQHLVPVVRVQGEKLHPEECNQIKSFSCFDKNILHNNKLVQYIQQLGFLTDHKYRTIVSVTSL